MKYYTLLNTPYLVYWLCIMIYGILTEPMPSLTAYALVISWFFFSFIIFFLLSNTLLDYIFNKYKTKRIFIIKTIIQSIILIVQIYLLFSYGYGNYSSVYHRVFMFDMLFTTVISILCFIVLHFTKIYMSYIQIEES